MLTPTGEPAAGSEMSNTNITSLEACLAMPETKPYSEWHDGRIVQKTGGDTAHALSQSSLGGLLYEWNQTARFGEALFECHCIFGPTGHRRALCPDIIVISSARLTRTTYMESAPDVAVAVLSPDERATRLAENIAFYLRHGVRLIWVVDPPRRAISVLPADGEPRTLGSRDALDGGAVLPGFRVVVNDIFAPLDRWRGRRA